MRMETIVHERGDSVWCDYMNDLKYFIYSFLSIHPRQYSCFVRVEVEDMH